MSSQPGKYVATRLRRSFHRHQADRWNSPGRNTDLLTLSGGPNEFGEAVLGFEDVALHAEAPKLASLGSTTLFLICYGIDKLVGTPIGGFHGSRS